MICTVRVVCFVSVIRDALPMCAMCRSTRTVHRTRTVHITRTAHRSINLFVRSFFVMFSYQWVLWGVWVHITRTVQKVIPKCSNSRQKCSKRLQNAPKWSPWGSLGALGASLGLSGRVRPNCPVFWSILGHMFDQFLEPNESKKWSKNDTKIWLSILRDFGDPWTP